MQCTNPFMIRNPNKLAGVGKVPNSFLVPCGKCMACRIAKTREWTSRLIHELEVQRVGCFITLTYDDEHLPVDAGLSKRDLQLFLKRFRKAISPVRIKYFACGEYGDRTFRPHYHLAVVGWEPPVEDLLVYGQKNDTTYFTSSTLNHCWISGFTVVGGLSHDSAQYVTGYVRKKLNGPRGVETYGNVQFPFQLQSQGLGLEFAKSKVDEIIRKGGILNEAGVPELPKYYLKKLGPELRGLPTRRRELAEEKETVKREWFYSQGLGPDDTEELITAQLKQKNRRLVTKERRYDARFEDPSDY